MRLKAQSHKYAGISNASQIDMYPKSHKPEHIQNDVSKRWGGRRGDERTNESKNESVNTYGQREYSNGN